MSGYKDTAARAPDSPAEAEDLIDTLIAISVVAKRLAEKLRKRRDKEAQESSGQEKETEETG